MSWANRAAAFCRRWRNRAQAEQELDEEVRSYFETMVERYVARGFSKEEAWRAARIQFEGLEQVKEKVREARMGATMETILQDLRYGLRVLQKSPGFTAIAVVTLALGIGANTAIFSLINAVILRSLPVQHPEQLALLTDPEEAGVLEDTTENGERGLLSYQEFKELRSYNTVFAGLFAAQSEVSNLDVFLGEHSRQPIRAQGQLVSGEFFQVLGVQPVLGRVFTPDEDKAPGRNPVAVMSYDFWQRQFAGHPDVIGNTLRAAQGIFQIVGVTAPGFRGVLVGSNADLWFPITMQQQVVPGRDYLKPRDTLWLQVMGRLAPGVSFKNAQAGINVTFQQAIRAWSAALPTETERRKALKQKIILRPGSRGASAVRGQFGEPLILLMAMVGVLLLIACANIANLTLARATARQRELGVRLALGAGRSRLVSQLLTESLIVSVLGGVLGVLLSLLGSRLLLSLVSTGVSDLYLQVAPDVRVLSFTLLISLGTGILLGLIPAIRVTQLDVNRTIATNVRGATGARGGVQAGRVLAIAQIALSLVLLMGAALFVRSLYNTLTENLGYSRDHLLAVRVDPIAAGYKRAGVTALYQRVRNALRAIPGVRDVTLSNTGLFGGDSGDHLSIEASSVTDPEKLASGWTEVGPDYAKTLGIPLLRGRDIDESDAARGAPVCLINESFARQFFSNSDPIGKHITDEYPTTRETFEIVGVVGDAREHSPAEKKNPRFYANVTHPIGSLEAVTFIANSSGDPTTVAAAVRQAIRQVDPHLAILKLRTANEELSRRLTRPRLIAQLATFFGTVAIFMAGIGLFGVISYSTARRTSEIGVRMALGASGTAVVRMVLREAFGMVVIGTVIGLCSALTLGRLISSRLYGLTPADPAALGITILIIVSVALLAGYLPARRASRIDPMVSLRCE